MHTPETRFERIDHTVGGVVVNIDARVAAGAGPGEAPVSSTVHDLVSGSGIPGEWRLFAVGQAT